jgi:hypothetical protein
MLSKPFSKKRASQVFIKDILLPHSVSSSIMAVHFSYSPNSNKELNELGPIVIQNGMLTS